ncbi:hypothetical protein, partial [Frankia sp. Cr1]|uniref:hypothetical protein n=1 Tax=Frankia sp. Cr1 TaxID=3073931 RepID=UPI002AD2B5C3
VNTVLDKPELGLTPVLDFYENAYRKEFTRLRAQVYFLYGGHAGSKDSYFWHARSQFEVPGIEPEKAFISLIAGAFAHRSWYSRYLERLAVPTNLRNTIEGIFEGKSAGSGVDLTLPLAAASTYSQVDDFAIDGSHLRPSRSVVSSAGAVLADTPALSTVLAAADGTKNGSELADLLVEQGIAGPEQAQVVIHEAISYGFLAPATSDILAEELSDGVR